MQTTIVLNKENFGREISSLYEEMIFAGKLKIKLEREKDSTIRLQKMLDDPENTSYGPFDNAEDAIKFLNRDL